MPPNRAGEKDQIGCTTVISVDIINTMSDLLIRDVPDDVLAGLDARAAELGLSRVEYIRRRLTQDARASRTAVTPEDLQRCGQAIAGVLDEELMREAWN